MYRFLLPLAVAAFGLSGNAQAMEPSGPLTLQAALEMALSANTDLSAAQHELQAVEASVLQAGVLPNPSIELGVEDQRRQTRESVLLLSQPIELGGKRSARVQAAERGRAVASAQLQVTRAEVRSAVITAFFDVLAAQERLRLAEDSVGLAQRATLVAARRVAAGKVSPVEETRARVAESNVRLELAQARSELASARRRLGAIWSNPAPRFTQAEGQLDKLPVLPDPSSLNERLTEAPALVRVRHELERRQALAEVERSRRIPDVTVSVGVKRVEEAGRNLALFGVSIPLPIFDSNRGNVLESLRRVDKARDELAAAEVRLDSELALARERLSVSRQEADSLQKEVVPGAESAYDAAVKGFEFGKFGFLDVLDAQRTLLQAKSSYLRALAEAHRAAADIDRIIGQ